MVEELECKTDWKKREMVCKIPSDNKIFLLVREDKSGELQTAELFSSDEIREIAESEGAHFSGADRDFFKGNVNNFEVIRVWLP